MTLCSLLRLCAQDSSRPCSQCKCHGLGSNLCCLCVHTPLVLPKLFLTVLLRLLPIGWIRVSGVLASLYGFYYLGTGYVDRQSHQASQGFYRATVWGRLFLFAAFSVIVWRREVERTLLIPAVVNLLGALTMHLALLRQQRRTT